MNKRLIGLVGILIIALVVLVVISTRPGEARPAEGQSGTPADPQTLLIPRWFLEAQTLEGQVVTVPAGQQDVTLQFEEGGKANGTGGCNSFGASYQAGTDGSLTFGPITATRMACAEGMELENAFFEALGKVQQFERPEGKLVLKSADGQTTIVFRMPPK